MVLTMKNNKFCNEVCIQEKNNNIEKCCYFVQKKCLINENKEKYYDQKSKKND